MKKKHKVLSWWATLLLTFAAFVGVIGVTVLVMYLTGQFNKVVVWPEDMTFSTDVDGAGFFDGEGNLFVATNFSRESTKPATSVFLTISTTTQEVTEDEVTLFLDGDRTKTSNGVITVPQTIRLNKPFEVKLDVTDGYVNGGTAVITAVSADQTLERQTLKVFVDKPVESFDVQISGGEKDSDGQFNVVTGATFNFQTLFTPQESAKAFSQEDAQKQVFFHNTSAYIDYDWENHNFFTQKQSGEAFDEVTFYVFANAAFQNQVLDRFSDLVNQPSMYNSSVITYLTQNFQESENTYLTKTINVHVKNATVTYVNIDKAGGTIDGGTRDKYFTLTARSASGDNTDSLGINIRENATSSNLDGLLGNVGIKIDKNDSSLILDNRRIDQLNVAGYVMKVVSNVSSQGTTYQITKELFDKTNYQKYLTAPAGTEYYILPCTSPTYATEYYWRIAATDVLPHTLHVNFFFEDASGRYANFFAFDPSAENAEKTVTYVAEDHPQEPAAWTNRNTVDLEIAYDEEGLAQNAQVTLSDYVQEIASTNVYTKTKFFLFVNNTDTHNISFDATEAFNVQPAKTYQQDYLGEELNIWGFANAAGYQLFEVDSDDLLIAKIRVPEKVEVYALIAIIQTDVDGKILLDNAGNYKIVNLSDLKRVRVDSALSVSNMTPVFTFTQVVPQDMASQIYYIPSAIRGEDGNQSIIRFTLQYNCGENSDAEDWARDARKIASAFDTRTLQVVCTDAQGVILDAPYVSMSSSPREMFEVDGQPGQLTATGTRKQTLYFVGEIAITKELFAYSASENTVTSMDIYLHLKFNNGRDDFDKSITKEGEATCNHFAAKTTQASAMTTLLCIIRLHKPSPQTL